MSADPDPCDHPNLSDQLRCLDCGQHIPRLSPRDAMAAARDALRPKGRR